MKAVRWILCGPAAIIASLIVWLLEGALLHGVHVTYGGGFWYSIAGLAPGVLAAAVPPAIFVPLGVLISPSKERSVCLVFGMLAPFLSVGGVPLLLGQSVRPFWFASLAGTLLGACIGFLLSLRVQHLKGKATGSGWMR